MGTVQNEPLKEYQSTRRIIISIGIISRRTVLQSADNVYMYCDCFSLVFFLVVRSQKLLQMES